MFPSGGLPELVVEQGRDGFVCAAKTADALEAGLRHYLDGSEADLAMSKEAAKSSLARLGITRGAFTRAWLEVYRRPPLPAGDEPALPHVVTE